MSVTEKSMTSRDMSRILADRFNKEWNGTKREVPYSEVLKKRNARDMINDGLKLPVRDEGDNLVVANMALVHLVSYLNEHIERMNRDFIDMHNKFKEQEDNPLVNISSVMYRVRINSEILAYLLKTAIDKLIVLLAQAYGEYGVDSIGSILGNKRIETFCGGLLMDHSEFLDEINGLHNGYKHTFSNLQLMSVVNQIEPVMFSLYKFKNTTSQPTKIYHMICSNAVDSLNSLLTSAKDFTEEKAKQ